ncbi:hypothetical protein Hdeb2414_s0114g00799411 [Helianthus debilis subsp. tardiflorus]
MHKKNKRILRYNNINKLNLHNKPKYTSQKKPKNTTPWRPTCVVASCCRKSILYLKGKKKTILVFFKAF